MLGKAAFVLALAFNFLLLAQNQSNTDIAHAAHSPIRVRSLPQAVLTAAAHRQPDEVLQPPTYCAPLSVPPGEQCRYVHERCAAHQTSLDIPYLRTYFCASTSARPAFFGALVVWLVFLFSFLGITASDFFCPNLASIASVLGLDETVAGVTFLAFGNGSPDLFSTFSAMKAGSGSLAVGELVGAASFITSVVVGSLCIIRPFTVPRVSFLRDVGFFTVAITLLLVFCIDGKIHSWEAGLLVLLYVTYVIVVVAGTWWENRVERKRQREQLVRAQYRDDDDSTTDIEPYLDDPPQTADTLAVHPTRPRAHSNPVMRRSTSTQSLSRPDLLHAGVSIPARLSSSEILDTSHRPSPTHHQMPSFSLLGALEFRDVISSLRLQSNVSNLNVFDGPVSPYAGGRYGRSRALSRSGASSLTPTRHPTGDSAAVDPWDASLGLPLSERRSFDSDAPTPSQQHSPVLSADPAPLQQPPKVAPAVPHIAITSPPSPTLVPPQLDAAPAKTTLAARRGRWYVAQRVYHTLFPSLQHFGAKSWLGKVAAVLSVPALLALTVTLPVVVTPDPHEIPQHVHLDMDMTAPNAERVLEGRLVDIEEASHEGSGSGGEGEHEHENGVGGIADAVAHRLEEGFQDILYAEEEVVEAMHGVQYSRWLMAAQCVLGPILCWLVLLSQRRHALLYLLAITVASIAIAILVVIFSDKGNDHAARNARCFLGFAIAVVWIMAIADEVVAVLQTFGHIFGLSDAIIGLTIFAVGNSMGDFVADLSVASFAPLMAFAACFGGPMLNILLGVGLSGTYVIGRQDGGGPYHLDFSTTLLVSTVGLLLLLIGTMVFVPLNGYKLTRRWGVFLIACYLAIMTTNIVVEVKRL
ncbi:hypothetical protein AURDEDRAFT_122089 [Auricularia subglabra TFB-10046 SS5]|nr:hypothetical protein AURDEDRAFT_122089 [Auricularia subglabra TFB-10046 SS5]